MKKDILTPWNKLYRLLDLERRDILQVLYYAIFAGVISLTIPLGIQAIVNYIQGAQISTSWILLTIAVTVGVGFVGVLRVLQMEVIEDIQQKIFTRTAFEFTYRFPNIRVSELFDRYPPELSNRFFDVLTLQKGVQKLLLDFPAAVLQIVFGLLLLSFYHPFFIAFGLVLIMLFYFLFKFTIDDATNTSIKESKKKYAVAFWIQQVASQFKMLKITDNNYELNRTNGLVNGYLTSRQEHFKVVINQYKMMVVFKILITLGLLLIGGILVLNQQMNIGQFVAAEIIIVNMINSVDKIGQTLETIYDMVTAVEKISEVTQKKLDHPLAVSEEIPTVFPIKIEGLHTEINHIDGIFIEEREMINLVGGQLKINDFFNFLSGMRKAWKGKIFLDKQEISNVDLKKYQAQIGLVLNTDKIFEGSIWNNVCIDRPLGKEEVLRQMEEFGILNEIQNLPYTLETGVFHHCEVLSEKASKIICLLRVLFKRPQLLMIEDGLIHSEQEQNALLKFAREHGIALLLSSIHPLDLELKRIYL